MFSTVAIVGVGLIGGSLGMALRERGLARRVIGIPRRIETVAEALAVGAVDEGGIELSRLAEADLVVLAPPVRAIPVLVAQMREWLQPGALVTDVGSTKAELMRSLPPLLPPHVNLIGGHPMAGSEKGGVLAGRADLFEGAIWVITPHETADPSSVEQLTAMIEALGARPVRMDPDEHDIAVARISHLPHVAAAALAEVALDGGSSPELLRMLVAGGFRDTTRIASSPPEMWRDICLTNQQAILSALDDLDVALARFRAALVSADPVALQDAFQRGKTVRDTLLPPARPRS